MKVYIVEQVLNWGDTIKYIGIFAKKEDAIDMCIASNIEPKNSITEHEVIE